MQQKSHRKVAFLFVTSLCTSYISCTSCVSTELQSKLILTGGQIMAATAFVRARIDETLKNEAAAVLADMGLTVSDVVRIALTKIAKEKALPFEMRVPNTLTAETLGKSNRGEDVHHAKDADDLFKQLDI